MKYTCVRTNLSCQKTSFYSQLKFQIIGKTNISALNSNLGRKGFGFVEWTYTGITIIARFLKFYKKLLKLFCLCSL